ncbi:hypothetical protein SNE40_002734 [Patella caerulea]|uniref:Uncharacterized protein n=1 Tax=Patella caerulea TaxID=87958 RepID=A0AAN8Q7T1_PATCE
MDSTKIAAAIGGVVSIISVLLVQYFVYGKRVFNIHVTANNDRIRKRMAVANGSANVIRVSVSSNEEFVDIGPGDSLTFYSDEPLLTITFPESDTPLPACTNFRPPPERSVIVTAQATVQLAKYGSVWTDEKSRDHSICGD